MSKIIRIFTVTFLFLGSYSFADVDSTREVLSGYSLDNPRVLEVYDRVAKSWSEYDELYDGQWDLEKLLKAVEYVAEKHEGQVRKDAEKTPYIIHPIGVAKLAWDIGGIRSVNVLTSALLHDALEDTEATEEEIEALFGPRVLYTVKEVTNDPDLSGEENKQRQVDHAPTMSLDGQLVKLSDRLYNVIDLDPPPPSWTDEKVDGYYTWGEKLLFALRGTNADLEQALKDRIDNHRGVNPSHENSIATWSQSPLEIEFTVEISLSNEIYTFTMLDNLLIRDLKNEIQKSLGIPQARQRLIYNAYQMEDDIALKDYRIGNQSRVFLILRAEQ